MAARPRREEADKSRAEGGGRPKGRGGAGRGPGGTGGYSFSPREIGPIARRPALRRAGLAPSASALLRGAGARRRRRRAASRGRAVAVAQVARRQHHEPEVTSSIRRRGRRPGQNDATDARIAPRFCVPRAPPSPPLHHTRAKSAAPTLCPALPCPGGSSFRTSAPFKPRRRRARRQTLRGARALLFRAGDATFNCF